MGLTIPYKVKDQDQVKVTVAENQKDVKVVINIPEQSDYSLVLVLKEPVLRESSVQVNLQNITVLFSKKDQSRNWLMLEEAGRKKEEPSSRPEVVAGNTFYPSNSHVKRDWNKIDKELEKELQKNPEEDAMNKLFKQIYANGNEETKRAMVKSFQTSGGTVLSTNWNEVEKKDYEEKDRPSPPEGQQWQKWDK